MKRWRLDQLIWVGLVFLLLVGCSTGEDEGGQAAESEGLPMTIEVTSTAFNDGQAIPSRYTCDGQDISPALAWRNVPAGAASLVLIMDDPDAPRGNWVHWVIFNMPTDVTGLPEASDAVPSGATEGNNSWKRTGYGGPCPPSGTHRYFFKLYAVDTLLDLSSGVTRGQVERAMEGHILDWGELMGTYTR